MAKEKTFDDYFEEAVTGKKVEEISEEVKPDDQDESKKQETQAEESANEHGGDNIFNKIPDVADAQQQDNQDEGETPTPEGDDVDWKALFEKEKQKTSSWNGRIRKANERTEDAEKKLTDTLQRIEVLEKQLQEKSDKPQKETLPEDKDISSDDADLTSFFEEYPDLEKPLKKLVRLEAEAIAEDRLSKIAPRVDQLAESSKEEGMRRHFQMIEDAHSDYKKIVDDGYLQRWIDSQPTFLKDSLERVRTQGNAKEVIEMLDSFKRTTGWKVPSTTPKKREPNPSKVDALLAVEGNTGGPPKGQPDSNDFDAAWDEVTAK